MRAIPRILAFGCVVAIAACGIVAIAADTATPSELVKTYDSLATVIVGSQQTEHDLVLSILATTYGHAEATLAAAKAKIDAGQDARADVETLATLVSQLGNEGDAAVAAIRKRLIEAGHHHHHHHHAKGEEEQLYDEGFVVVTRAAKKVFLDAAARIGKMASNPDAAALDAQWKIVSEQYKKLHEA